MKIIETPILGCYELQPNILKDERGRLVKIFHQDIFLSLNLDVNFKEEYYTISKKDVLRGLHFQLPPHDHIKCVTCLSGKLFDVIVDLRKESPTFKQHFALELDSNKGNMLYIPKGLAHGFFVLTENSIFLNKTTTVYNPEHDTGIHWNSCGIKWPNLNPILSEKDKEMTSLNKFIEENPF